MNIHVAVTFIAIITIVISLLSLQILYIRARCEIARLKRELNTLEKEKSQC